MEKKDFILVLVALIILSGGYYLYSNSIWPFVGLNDSGLPNELSQKVYVVSGVVKEVYDTVVVLESDKRINGFPSNELMAVVGDNTDIFKYEVVNESAIRKVDVNIKDVKVGDKVALTCDDDITTKENGVFLASSIAVYNK